MATSKKKKSFDEWYKERHGENGNSGSSGKSFDEWYREKHSDTDQYEEAGTDNSLPAPPPIGQGIYTFSDEKKTKPIGSTEEVVPPVPGAELARQLQNEKWQEDRNGFLNKGHALSDGWQPGDLIKSNMATTADAIISASEGAGGLVEGVTDLLAYGVAGVGKAIDPDAEWHEILKQGAMQDTLSGFDDVRKLTGIDEYSYLGKKSQSVTSGIGQVVTMMGIGQLAAGFGAGSKAVTMLNSAINFLSSTGRGVGDALKDGATDEEAAMYGLLSGTANALSELMFSGLGKAAQKFGYGSGSALDDALAKKVTDKISNAFLKNALQYGIKSGAEGLEEVVAGGAEAISKWLTYADDKSLKSLLQIIEDEELLDQFVIGALVSGGMQAPDLQTSLSTGTDFITGESIEDIKNAQNVVNTLTDEQIAAAEKDGKKLTAKQKADIKKDIEQALDRGELNTEDIERIVGGEDYTNYKAELDRQEQIQNEKREILKTPVNKFTVEQQERLAELRAMKTDKEMVDSLKASLDERVRKATASGKLAESYENRARRGQAFQADLSKYKGKALETVKKAVESGVLNDTRRTHELVDLAAKIAEDKGIDIDFTNNQRLAESGFAIKNGQVDGFINENGITLNANSAKALNKVVGHEITHAFEGTELYESLSKAVTEYSKSKGEYDSRLKELTEIYKGVKDADVQKELVADLVGDYIFADENFVRNLHAGDRNLFQKVFDEVKYLCKVATAGSEQEKKLLEAKRLFEKVYREGEAKPGDNTQYSISTTEDGIKYVRLDGNIFLKQDGTEMTAREAYNALIGQKITLEDGDVITFVKKLPGIDLYRELFRKLPGYEEGIDVKAINETLNKNIVDLISGSEAQIRNEEQRHEHVGIKDFDQREVYATDGSEVYRLELNIANLTNGGKIAYVKRFIEKASTEIAEKIKKAETARQTRLNQPLDGGNQSDATKAIIPQNSEMSSGSAKFSISPETDKTYLDAVKRGDTETAQRMVDEAAKDAGYNYHLYHGTNADFTVFDLRNHGGKNGKGEGYGIYLAENREISAPYGKNVIDSYTRFNRLAEGNKKTLSYAEVKKLVKKSCEIDAQRAVEDGEYDTVAEALRDTWVSNYVYTYDYSSMSQVYADVANILWENNDNDGELINEIMASSGAHYDYNNALNFYDTVLTPTTGIDGFHYIWGNKDGSGVQNDIYLAFSSNQIKSADPVTYDDNGNVIPLSERFNSGNNDIRFSLSPEPSQGVDRIALENIAPTREQIAAAKRVTTPAKKVDTLPMREDIAPIKETPKKAEPKVAKVLTEESGRKKKGFDAWAAAKNLVLDKGMVFEDLALKTKNRTLQARWNSIRYANSKAQKMIGKGNGKAKALTEIRKEVEQSGKTEEFYNYLYHKHNVDRMSLETNKTARSLGMKNKPVFGDDVTAKDSARIVAEYEKSNPEFKVWAKDVYDYMNTLREMLVTDGVISRETANLWAELYPSYVPIRRAGKEGLAVNVPLDTRRTGVNAPIKSAKGGNSNIEPLFGTMALRTEQTYRAIARNRFGIELRNTLGSELEASAQGVDETIDSIDDNDSLLKEGKNGQLPTFTVFENGKKVTFEITDEMYNAMKPTSEVLRYRNKVLNFGTSLFRSLVTEYNPIFMIKNPIKDMQDVLINSQHPAKTYAAIPKAVTEMAKNGEYYREYLENGGEQNTYFESDSKTFTKENEGFKKWIGMPFRAISWANGIIERIPRLAEYIASREAGRDIDVSMLDAARVTTNFAAGGDLTKALNRNGFTFLNASVQGAMQNVRNVREAKANGLKGWVQLASKVTAAGLPALLLNALLWDDDEEYEELSDYVKQNYYIVAKLGDGTFVRIPKGRTVAVIQNAFEQMKNLVTGDDEVDMQAFFELVINNLAPNNPLENNVIAPIQQALTNKTWYGDDLVPERLQDLPAAEQYDESIDVISKWLGETTNTSPYKWNYVLDQYSGVLGDVALPMLTPASDGGGLLAPFTDAFTTDSTMKNQNISDFYDTVDELNTKAKGKNATNEDVLRYKYMSSVNSELSDLYKAKRFIQNSDMTDEEKDDAVRKLQRVIDDLAKESLGSYKNVRIDGNRAAVGDKQYKYEKGEWKKITDDKREKRDRVVKYLNTLDSDYGEKLIIYRSIYKNDDTYNKEIVEYLNSRDDISYDEMVAILEELGMSVKNGRVYWD